VTYKLKDTLIDIDYHEHVKCGAHNIVDGEGINMKFGHVFYEFVEQKTPDEKAWMLFDLI
jgi:hypothetical protein